MVVNFCQSADKAEAVRADIECSGGRAITVRADMAQSADIDAMFDRVEAELGAVDILVNNAAVKPASPCSKSPRTTTTASSTRT